MPILKDHSRIPKKDWNDFVLGHPQGTIFQTYEMYELYEKSPKFEPIMIVAQERGRIVGILLSVIQKEYEGFIGDLTARSIIWGGPLIEVNQSAGHQKEVFLEILQQLNEIASNKAIFTQIRNIFDFSTMKGCCERHGWVFEDHLNIIVDLSKSEETLWKEVHSKRRNEIRRARKEGTGFSEIKGPSAIRATYPILKEVYRRAKLPLAEIAFFQMAYEIIGDDSFRIFAAVNDGKIIGTMYVLCFKDVMYDWYAGSYQDYYKKFPNDLIPWGVFMWGKRNSYKYFDFGGAGKPDVPYGVRDYKLKFGGELVNYGRFVKIHKPFLMQIGKLGLRLYSKIC